MQMCHVNSPWFILAYLGPSTKTVYTLRGRETESTKSKMFPLISNAQKVNFSIKNGIGKLWLFCFFTTRIVLLRNWTSFCLLTGYSSIHISEPETRHMYCTVIVHRRIIYYNRDRLGFYAETVQRLTNLWLFHAVLYVWRGGGPFSWVLANKRKTYIISSFFHSTFTRANELMWSIMMLFVLLLCE